MHTSALSQKVFEQLSPLAKLKLPDDHVGAFAVDMDPGEGGVNYFITHDFRPGRDGTKWRRVSVLELQLEFGTTSAAVLCNTIAADGGYGTTRGELDRMVHDVRRFLVGYIADLKNAAPARTAKGRK